MRFRESIPALIIGISLLCGTAGADPFFDAFFRYVNAEGVMYRPDVSAIRNVSGNYRFLFLLGFGGDSSLVGKGFDQFGITRRFLIDQGVATDDIGIYRTHSDRAVRENVTAFDKALEDWRRGSSKKIVIVGHSFGGVIAFQWALSHEASFEHWVHRLYTLQAPLRGSDCSDYGSGVWRKEFGRVGWFERVKNVKAWSWMLDHLLGLGASDQGMRTSVSEERLRSTSARNPRWTHELLAHRVVFIRGRVPADTKLSWRIAGAQSFLNKAFPGESNDGLIRTELESWPDGKTPSRVVTLSTPLAHHLFPWFAEEKLASRALGFALLRDLVERK